MLTITGRSWGHPTVDGLTITGRDHRANRLLTKESRARIKGRATDQRGSKGHRIKGIKGIKGPADYSQRSSDSVDFCQDRLVLNFAHWEIDGMARTNRRDVLADGEIQVVHCINRCVRRAYLCGQDPLTGADREHRRELIRQRLEFLAGIMGIHAVRIDSAAVLSRSDIGLRNSKGPTFRSWSHIFTTCQNPPGRCFVPIRGISGTSW